jgi:hypothetical protein
MGNPNGGGYRMNDVVLCVYIYIHIKKQLASIRLTQNCSLLLTILLETFISYFQPHLKAVNN